MNIFLFQKYQGQFAIVRFLIDPVMNRTVRHFLGILYHSQFLFSVGKTPLSAICRQRRSYTSGAFHWVIVAGLP